MRKKSTKKQMHAISEPDPVWHVFCVLQILRMCEI